MTVTVPAQPGGMPAERPVDSVTLTIDDIEVTVPKGTLAIRVAELLGNEIPRFCDHPLLDPVAACRACLIEIDGMPKPQPACAITVADGMRIRTQVTSEVADDAQKGVMEFLLVNHPLDCPVCDKGGECPLQNQAMSVGRPESRFELEKRNFEKPINVSDLILLDRERCVSCARCTRFSEQIAGDPMLELLERGANQQVGTGPDAPFESYYSGNTIQICPVGALTSADYRFRARPFDLVSVPTTCEHCASGCSLRTDYRRDVVTRRLAWDEPAVNEEWNCDKGRFAFGYLNRERLQAPLVRDGDRLRPASWPEALDAAARGLAGTRAGVLVGGRVTLEDAYAYARFARVVLGTDDLDFRARPASEEESQFLASRVAGTAGPTYSDVERAPVVVLAGFEPEDESPIVFLRLRKAVRKHAIRVLSVSSHTTRGLEKLRATLVRTVPGAEPSALRSDEVTEALRVPGAILMVGERLAAIPGALSAAAEVADSTGARLAWVPRRAGERGALDAGALHGLLPGGRPLVDPEARAEVAAVWGVDPDALPTTAGRDTDGILHALTTGQLTGLVVAGIQAEDHADPARVLAAVEAASFVVSLETRVSGISEHADVVLPVAVVTEKSGSFVDWEGRRRAFGQVFRDSVALSDARVLAMLADAMDTPIGYGDSRSLRQEIDGLGAWSGGRPAAPTAAPASGATAGSDQAVLASWRLLLDLGTLQEGEEHLARTRRPSVARMSRAMADRIGARAEITGPRGSISLPVEVADLPDGVVWVPLNSPGSQVPVDLGVLPGSIVGVRSAR